MTEGFCSGEAGAAPRGGAWRGLERAETRHLCGCPIPPPPSTTSCNLSKLYVYVHVLCVCAPSCQICDNPGICLNGLLVVCFALPRIQYPVNRSHQFIHSQPNSMNNVLSTHHIQASSIHITHLSLFTEIPSQRQRIRALPRRGAVDGPREPPPLPPVSLSGRTRKGEGGNHSWLGR